MSSNIDVWGFLNSPWGNSIDASVTRWMLSWPTQSVMARGLGSVTNNFFFYAASSWTIPMTLDKACKLSVLTAPDRFVTYIARTLKMPEHYIQNIRWISPLACLCLGTWATSSASAFVTSKIGSGFFGGIAQGLIYCVHFPLVQLSTYAPDDFSGKGILSLRNTLADTRLIKILSYVIPVPQKVTEFAAGKPWRWNEEGDPSRISIVAAASCALTMFVLTRWSKLSPFTMISTAYTIAAVTELCMIHKVNRLGDEQSAFFS